MNIIDNRLNLILENGAVFEGQSFGAAGDITGEIVFTTGMTGYLETLTDQSYHGQIVLQTFPLIGNYGIIPSDFESVSVGPLAYIVKTPCQDPSNFRSEGTLGTFLREKNIVGLWGIDTRALTKIIREQGVMNGRITKEQPDKAMLRQIRSYQIKNAVQKVSCTEPMLYKAEEAAHSTLHSSSPCPATAALAAPLPPSATYMVAMLDFGRKESMIRELTKRGCDVRLLPCDSPPEEILRLSPDGIMLSNGPGDPADNGDIIRRLKVLLETKIPIFGICLGHQLLALAHGFKTGKLKYGHRGANQPVKDLKTGRVYISSQNHGYTVDPDSIDPGIADQWFINVNDQTCEGLYYKQSPAFSVQFHPEACGGPQDTLFLFDLFIKKMEAGRYAAE
ncbi:carbamoyl-phosphate synthase small subunit [Anaerotaenia torta]|uniref:carbamoyl phosphate synthase small subunit n=1 Tax=Anaerotaenia torta TaxID=433293 RepID=UPI003D196A8C